MALDGAVDAEVDEHAEAGRMPPLHPLRSRLVLHGIGWSRRSGNLLRYAIVQAQHRQRGAGSLEHIPAGESKIRHLRLQSQMR
jgi:hypothetical protein